MAALESLIACAGKWEGTSRLHESSTAKPDPSDSTLTVTPVAGGRFVRLDYTWIYNQVVQEGSCLIGFEKGTNEATAYWLDSWHMSDKALTSRGKVAEGQVKVFGTYPAPPGPDWGWRTIITPAAEALKLVMYNVTPDGQEELAVEADYRRVK